MKTLIQETAKRLGFAAVGVTTAEPVAAAAWLREAVAAGRIGTMAWLGRDPERRCDPRSLLPGARSVICCALAYGENGIAEGESGQSGEKGVARFARGADYHGAVRAKLEALWEAIRGQASDARAKICVDTSPVLEKALAARAGLGWVGKHTLVLNRDLGSFFVLGEVITDLQLEPDAPYSEDLCGECRACIDACPTAALTASGVLDARRCISYLTIEQARGSRTTDYGSRTTNHGSRCSYGCDRCQEACPYNRGRGTMSFKS